MQASTRIGLALCVLVAGVTLAGLFRKSPESILSPTDASESQLTLRQPGQTPLLAANIEPHVAADARAAKRPMASVHVGEVPTAAPPMPLPAAAEVPKDRSTFPPALHIGSSVRPSPETGKADDDWQLHEVVDGDTLEALAVRYYGQAALAEVIQRANSQLVKDPQILKVGSFLKIPARSSIGPSTAALPSEERAPGLQPHRQQGLIEQDSLRGNGWRKGGGRQP